MNVEEEFEVPDVRRNLGSGCITIRPHISAAPLHYSLWKVGPALETAKILRTWPPLALCTTVTVCSFLSEQQGHHQLRAS